MSKSIICAITCLSFTAGISRSYEALKTSALPMAPETECIFVCSSVRPSYSIPDKAISLHAQREKGVDIDKIPVLAKATLHVRIVCFKFLFNVIQSDTNKFIARTRVH